SGAFTLAGRATGGHAEVAVDAGPFLPVIGEESWSIELSTAGWEGGYHVVQARVIRESSQAVHLLNLYWPGVYPPPTAPPGPFPQPPATPSPSESLVGSWLFTLGSGIDSSGNGYDAEVHGAVASTGPLGGALDFDGIDDAVVVRDESGKPPAELAELAYGSIAVRFRYDSVSASGAPAEIVPLFHYGLAPSTPPSLSFDNVSIYIGHGSTQDPLARQIYFTVIKGSTPALCFDSNPVALGEGVWYHYVVTIGPAGHHAYLDGLELALRYNSGTTPASYAFFPTVGQPEWLAFGTAMFGVSRNWWNLDGRIDEVNIYDRVLTAAEVGELYRSGP
ncbi:MAG: LamG-like jellyroll fold domain-containing protein, partial [Candidatus Binatia bacterium]